MTIPPELLTLIQEQDAVETPEAIHALSQALLQRHPETIQAILFYGSCLRSDPDIEGIVDLYLIVDDYTSINSSQFFAIANHWLPPNVFYAEVPYRDRTVRTKYAILSIKDFQESTSMRWFHSYFWARFAQPTKILFAVSPEVKQTMYEALAQAVLTFLRRAIPQTPAIFQALDIWKTGLSLTYQAELRTERSGRISQILDANRAYYERAADVAIPHLSMPITSDKSTDPIRYQANQSTWPRFVSSCSWLMRRMQGKLLSVLRLIKGLFTFEGGVDYILWKIERHSGVSIELTPSQRKHPLLASPGVFWKLYRKGAFR